MIAIYLLISFVNSCEVLFQNITGLADFQKTSHVGIYCLNLRLHVVVNNLLTSSVHVAGYIFNKTSLGDCKEIYQRIHIPKSTLPNIAIDYIWLPSTSPKEIYSV